LDDDNDGGDTEEGVVGFGEVDDDWDVLSSPEVLEEVAVVAFVILSSSLSGIGGVWGCEVDDGDDEKHRRW
jgi:hypothetical protein